MFGNVRLVFGTILENLRKSSESGRKSSGNRQKRRYQYVYIIKRTLHVSSKIWILCYSWQEQYLWYLRYCSCHSNIKFISSRHRVISSIYATVSIFIIRCIFFFRFIGREPTTWPANNCLQIMVCSCVVLSKCDLLQIIFCSCVVVTTLSVKKWRVASGELSESDLNIKTNLVIEW